MKLEERKVVITGATGGIGGEVAAELAAQGCSVLVTGRNSDKLRLLLDSLPGEGHRSVHADLTTAEGIRDLVAAANNFAANTLINCMGVNQLATLEMCGYDDVNALMSTNLIAPINVCRSMLRVLEKQPSATIVNVGSILGSIGYAGSTLYCASKFGLRGFSEALRRELSDTSINVMYFAPRATATALNSDAMNQMNQALGNSVDSPSWVAKQLLALLQRDRSGNRYLGRAEAFFVRLNALFPFMVDKAVSEQLSTIKEHCQLAVNALKS